MSVLLNHSNFKQNWATIVAYLILAALVVMASLTSDVFLTSRNIHNLMRQAVALGIVSIGQTLILISGGIDLSVGSVISLTSCLATGTIMGQGTMVFPAVALVIGVGLFIGFCNGIIVVKTHVSPLIVTLSMMSIIQGVVFVYTKGPIGELPPWCDFVAWGMVGFIPFPILILAAIAAIGIIVQKHTRFGRYLFAIGGNEEVARLSGIKADKIKISNYMVCSFLAAMTGLYLASRMGQGDPLTGERYMIDSIIPALIGGTSLMGGKGGIVGTLAGAFILTIANNILNLVGVETYWQWIVTGLIVIVSVSFYGKE